MRQFAPRMKTFAQHPRAWQTAYLQERMRSHMRSMVFRVQNRPTPSKEQ